MRRESGRGYGRGMVVGATIAVVVLGAAAAFAGSGIGGVFNLGQSNTVDARSDLKGSSSSSMLGVTNNGAGRAIALHVQPGSPPLSVDSSTLVPNLNADQVDGEHASDFLGVNGKAVDSGHADQADHATNADFATTASTSFNASSLGGVAASAYAVAGSCQDGLVHGWTAVFAYSGFSSTYTSTSPDLKNCAGGDVQARRAATGIYYVRFLNNGSAISFGNIFEVDSSSTTSTCVDDFISVDFTKDPTQSSSDPRVFRIEVRDADGGTEDCPFDLVIV